MTSTTSTPQQRWTIPDAVEAPRPQAVLEIMRRVRKATGLRAAGWVAITLAVVAGLVGWGLQWFEVRLAAVFVAFLVLIALGFTIGHPKFRLRLSVDGTRVVVGEPASGLLDVVSAAQRRSLPTRIDLPIGGEVASFSIPSLNPEGEVRQHFEIPTERRGVVVVGPARSVQGDPFALTGRETVWTDSMEVFVHPRTVMLSGRQTGFIHDLEGHASNRISQADMNFQSLREYVPGDDRRHIHWRSSAHIGTLMVRQFEETLQSRVCLGIDQAAASYVGEEFETAVSVVGSLALQSLREQNPLTMVTNTQVLPAVSGPRALDELSRLEVRGRTGLSDLVSLMIDTDPQASIVFVVTGAAASMDHLRRALSAFSSDTRVIGIRIDPDARLGVRGIANITYVTAQQLDDLPRLMRRAMA